MMQNNKAQHPNRQLARDLIAQTTVKRAQFQSEVAEELKTVHSTNLIEFPGKSNLITKFAININIDVEQLLKENLLFHCKLHDLSFDKQSLAEINDVNMKYIKRSGMDLRELNAEPMGVVARMMFKCWYGK